MRWRSTLLLIALGACACSRHAGWRADAFSIPHPDDSSKRVEYFLQKPPGSGPWPTVVFLHGHQDGASPGGAVFVDWGVLRSFAQRGYLAVAVSQAGYGNSSGPRDFCGPFTQHGVSGVIAKLRKDSSASPNKVVIEGVSRGALVAGLIAAHDPTIAGVVLISGLYDIPTFLSNPKSRIIRSDLTEETGGSDEALRARSVLDVDHDIRAALILNGAQDDRTDPDQAGRLAAEITAHGGKARAIVYPQYGHHIPQEARDKDIDAFIDGVLR